MSKKKNLKDYGPGELSMWVFNDEYLYRNRLRKDLREILEEQFEFTERQWDELEEDIADDEAEHFGGVL